MTQSSFHDRMRALHTHTSNNSPVTTPTKIPAGLGGLSTPTKPMPSNIIVSRIDPPTIRSSIQPTHNTASKITPGPSFIRPGQPPSPSTSGIRIMRAPVSTIVGRQASQRNTLLMAQLPTIKEESNYQWSNNTSVLKQTVEMSSVGTNPPAGVSTFGVASPRRELQYSSEDILIEEEQANRCCLLPGCQCSQCQGCEGCWPNLRRFYTPLRQQDYLQK